MSCYENTLKKYTVSKTVACKLSDDVIVNQPLQTRRLKEKTATEWFYKYNNKLFYQVAASHN